MFGIVAPAQAVGLLFTAFLRQRPPQIAFAGSVSRVLGSRTAMKTGAPLADFSSPMRAWILTAASGRAEPLDRRRTRPTPPIGIATLRQHG